MTVTNNSDDAARDRAHQLRRDRAGAARGRPRPPGVRQPLRRDRVARLGQRHHRHAPAALGQGAAALVVHVDRWRRDTASATVTCETDRARFLGRGRSTRDPICAGGRRAALGHDRRGARSDLRAAHPGAARARAVGLGGVHHARRHQPGARLRAGRPLPRSARGAARARPRVDLEPGRAARARPHAGRCRGLPGAGRLPSLWKRGAPRARSRSCGGTRGSQPLLWANGVSGDWPILLATIDSPDGLPTLRQLLAAHRYWRRRGMMVDLVVLNAHPPTYLQDLADRITAAVYAIADTDRDRPAGRRVRAPAGSARSRTSCSCCAPRPACTSPATGARWAGSWRRRCRTSCRRTTSTTRRSSRGRPPGATRGCRARCSGSAPGSRPCCLRSRRRRRASGLRGCDPTERRAPCRLDNGFGGLTADGDYEIRVSGDRVPPAPWSNVIANRARRLRGHRARRRLHLGREQLLLPAHALAQRSGERSGERGRSTCRTRRPASCGAPRRARSARTRRTPSGTARAPRRSSRSTAASPPISRSAWRKMRR